jgi:hypothetical protein
LKVGRIISSLLVPKPRTDKQRKEQLATAQPHPTPSHLLISLVSTLLHTNSLSQFTMNPNNNRGNEGEEEAQQRRIKPWGAADKRFLSSLITDGDVDIYSTDNGYIDRIREEYFPNRTERNFRRNFLNFSAEWDTEKAVEGGRRLEAGELIVE